MKNCTENYKISCRTIILDQMKKPLLIICCLISLYGWSQTNKDSIRIEVNSLKTSRFAIQAKIDTLKKVIIDRLLLEEQIRSGIDNSMEEIDSLTRIQVKLQRKKQLTANENTRIENLNKQLESSSKKLQEIDMELTAIINGRRNIIQQLQLAINLVNDLDGLIKELEETLK